MNRNPIPVLAVCVTFAVAGCSQNATSPPTLTPVPTSVSDEITSLGARLNQRDEELTHMGRGASLLLTLSTDPERYRPLIDFLTIIDEDEFRCLIIELTDYPLVLYAFHRSYVFPDGSHRPVFDRKSGLVLVDAVTRRAIDYVVGTGYRTEEHVSGEPWTTEWQQQDGTRVRYRILTSGFERIWDDAPERNGVEPNDGEQSIEPTPTAQSNLMENRTRRLGYSFVGNGGIAPGDGCAVEGACWSSWLDALSA